ncbi:MAG: hypothetical protein MJ252_20505, partial [archaeon]|nr:hypothetical protein [archaeon]
MEKNFREIKEEAKVVFDELSIQIIHKILSNHQYFYAEFPRYQIKIPKESFIKILNKNGLPIEEYVQFTQREKYINDLSIPSNKISFPNNNRSSVSFHEGLSGEGKYYREFTKNSRENSKEIGINVMNEKDFLVADNGLDVSNTKYKDYIDYSTKLCYLIWIINYSLFTCLSVLFFVKILM